MPTFLIALPGHEKQELRVNSAGLLRLPGGSSKQPRQGTSEQHGLLQHACVPESWAAVCMADSYYCCSLGFRSWRLQQSCKVWDSISAVLFCFVPSRFVQVSITSKPCINTLPLFAFGFFSSWVCFQKAFVADKLYNEQDPLILAPLLCEISICLQELRRGLHGQFPDLQATFP